MLNHETYPGALHVFLLFQVSGEQFYADVANDILLYVSRDLSDKVKHLWRFYQYICVELHLEFCVPALHSYICSKS